MPAPLVQPPGMLRQLLDYSTAQSACHQTAPKLVREDSAQATCAVHKPHVKMLTSQIHELLPPLPSCGPCLCCLLLPQEAESAQRQYVQLRREHEALQNSIGGQVR